MDISAFVSQHRARVCRALDQLPGQQGQELLESRYFSELLRHLEPERPSTVGLTVAYAAEALEAIRQKRGNHVSR